MKQRAIVILVCLLLGVVVNVSVAWGLQNRSITFANERIFDADQVPLTWWKRYRVQDFEFTPAQMTQCRQFGKEIRLYTRYPDTPDHHTLGSNAFRVRAGWPMLALEKSAWVQRETDAETHLHALELNRPWPVIGRWLPVRPLWPGFAINTVVYALAVLPIMLGIMRLTAYWRATPPGYCKHCAYDLRGTVHDVCPECGRSIHAARADAVE